MHSTTYSQHSVHCSLQSALSRQGKSLTSMLHIFSMMLLSTIWVRCIINWQIIRDEQWCVLCNLKAECVWRGRLKLNQLHVQKAITASVTPHLIYFYRVCHLPDVCSAPGKQRAFKKGRKENQYLCPFRQTLTIQWQSHSAGEESRSRHLRDLEKAFDQFI